MSYCQTIIISITSKRICFTIGAAHLLKNWSYTKTCRALLSASVYHSCLEQSLRDWVMLKMQTCCSKNCWHCQKLHPGGSSDFSGTPPTGGMHNRLQDYKSSGFSLALVVYARSNDTVNSFSVFLFSLMLTHSNSKQQLTIVKPWVKQILNCESHRIYG